MKRNTIRAITADRYNELIGELGLNQAETARFFQNTDNTIRHMERGKTLVDPRTAMLLEIMVAHDITPAQAVRSIRKAWSDPEKGARRFSRLIKRLGLSQRGAARFLGYNERTTRYYTSGDTPVERRTIMLLELMIKLEITPDEALQLINIKPKVAAKATAAALGPEWAPRYYDKDIEAVRRD